MTTIRLAHVEAQGQLPQICLRCGVSASSTVSQTFTWCPGWVSYLFFLGGLPYFIVAAHLTQRARLQLPMCPAHLNHWRKRSRAVLISFFALLAFLIVGYFALESGLIYFMACIGFLAQFVVVLILCQASAIVPTHMTEKEIVLAGISPLFLDAMVAREVSRVEQRRVRIEAPEERIIDLCRGGPVSHQAIQE